jgi:hypothetical protein
VAAALKGSRHGRLATSLAPEKSDGLSIDGSRTPMKRGHVALM